MPFRDGSKLLNVLNHSRAANFCHNPAVRKSSAILPNRMDCLMIGRILLDERNRLNSDDIEALSASYVFASHWVIASHHIALGLGKTGAVAVVGPAG